MKKVVFDILKKLITSKQKNNSFYATNFDDIVHPGSAVNLYDAKSLFYDIQ